MTCVFCEPNDDLCKRVFYEDDRWYAFLSSPPHTQGHTILASRPLAENSKNSDRCPKVMSSLVLGGLEFALPNVKSAIQEAYDPKPKDILLVSLRGDKEHFHIHLIPLWREEEQRWREVTGYTSAHLMEFLGSLEKKHDFEVLWKEAKERKNEEQQRAECTKLMSRQIEKLRMITKYRAMHNK
jgi:diadenosine tetraphosphate (Ap4A) HIT family hydrolase